MIINTEVGLQKLPGLYERGLLSKFAEPVEALPDLKVKKKIFLLKLNRVSELITSLGREFQMFGPWLCKHEGGNHQLDCVYT